jgi:DNA-binding PadR family transcriptional regulator
VSNDWANDWWATGRFPGGRPWTAAFAFGRGQRFFEAGEVRLAILSLLSEGPKHGYQLMKEMAERSGGVYKASAGSVYPTLQQLEDDELIISEQKGGRRTYTLTGAGRRELAKDPATVRRIWERAGEYEDWSRFMTPESASSFQAIGMLVKAAMRASRRAGSDRVRGILERARKELEEL